MKLKKGKEKQKHKKNKGKLNNVEGCSIQRGGATNIWRIVTLFCSIIYLVPCE